MPMQKGQQSQPAAVQGRPPPPIPSNCPPPPPPPQCTIFCGKIRVKELPVWWFDRDDWTCKEAMKSYNFRQKDNVVSSLCLGNVDIRVGVVFCNYVLGQNTSQHVDDCVFNPRAKERLLWQPLHIELDIPIMVKLGEIADEFHMYDLKEKVSAWMQNKNSRVLPPVASDTSSQKPARGGKPKRSSNAEQPDEDEFTDGETVVLSPQQVQWFDRADRHEMAKSSRH